VVLLALWIAPSGFGYWAAATSATAIAAAFINFGEVNGYLSGHGTNFRRTRRSILRANLGLAAVAFAIAGAYWLGGNIEVAILSATIAVTVPLIGDSDLLYSAGVKHKLYRRVVTSQVVSAASKLLVGVALAWWTHSAISIAIATAVYYVVIELVLGRAVPRRAVAQESDSAPKPKSVDRFKWAVNSVFQTLPVQIGFLVAQFAADPALLGIYYLAFQATLAVSGVLVAPISRVTLSTFANTAPERRAKVAARVASLVGSLLLAGAGLVALLSPLLLPILSPDWRSALPAAVVLLASLPIRIMGPILDAYQQSHNRWWQSTAFNVADTALTGFAALVALTGDVVLLAAAVAVAKMLLGSVRTIWVFHDQGASLWIWLTFPVLVGALAIVAGQLVGEPWNIACAVLGGVIGLVWGIVQVRRN
jgi:O-antigen/teichoic acid export membrane protein